MLCSKLRGFSYGEIEFFLPQLCHLVISIDNESMALEEFLIDLCEESVNGALLVGIYTWHNTGIADADIVSRPFGCSRRICMTYLANPPLMLSRRVAECTTESRISSSVAGNLREERGYTRMCCQSPFCRA